MWGGNLYGVAEGENPVIVKQNGKLKITTESEIISVVCRHIEAVFFYCNRTVIIWMRSGKNIQLECTTQENANEIFELIDSTIRY